MLFILFNMFLVVTLPLATAFWISFASFVTSCALLRNPVLKVSLRMRIKGCDDVIKSGFIGCDMYMRTLKLHKVLLRTVLRYLPVG